MFGYQIDSVRVLEKFTRHPNRLRKSWESLKDVNQNLEFAIESETHFESTVSTGRKNKIITINQNEQNEIRLASACHLSM